MGTDLVQRSAHARALFELADRMTGLPIARLSAEGPFERLTKTDVAQPAVVATSLAALSFLREELSLEPAAVAGHSVGELSAYVAAGALDEESGLRLVHERAQAMADACDAVDGGMAAIVGLEADTLRGLCTEVTQNGSSVEVVNFNAPGQLVVAGSRDAMQRLAGRARAAGARRLIPLNVGGPFHSAYMRPAADVFGRALAQTRFERASLPVVANVSAQPLQGADELREELAVQLYSPVRWIESLQRLAQMGCDRFLEVGPGSVLAGMVRRTLPGMRVASFGSLADLETAAALVGA